MILYFFITISNPELLGIKYTGQVSFHTIIAYYSTAADISIEIFIPGPLCLIFDIRLIGQLIDNFSLPSPGVI